jgi:hypothetical protein
LSFLYKTKGNHNFHHNFHPWDDESLHLTCGFNHFFAWQTNDEVGLVTQKKRGGLFATRLGTYYQPQIVQYLYSQKQLLATKLKQMMSTLMP